MADGVSTTDIGGGQTVDVPNVDLSGGVGPGLSSLVTSLLGAGLGGIAGGIPTIGTTSGNFLQNLINLIQSTTQTGIDTRQDTGFNTTGTTAQQTAGTAVPLLGPEAQALMGQLTQKYMGLTAPSLTGYGAGQTANINAQADAQRNALQSILASRGLATSPVAATAQAGIEQNRANQITAMQQQLPLLQHQMNLQNLAGAAGFFGAMPKGQATTGTTTGTTGQAGTTSATQTGGVTTTANQLQQQQAMGKSAQQSSQGGGLGGALKGAAQGLAAILPFLFMSDERLKKDIEVIPQDKAIEKIRALKARQWEWKGGKEKSEGFVAQEMEKVLPELVSEVSVKDTNLKAINYAGLIPYLVGAVQNLDSRIEK